MVKRKIQQLMSIFPDSYINGRFELILEPRTNLYFLLENIKTVEDLQFKVVVWCSRAASKEKPYYDKRRNDQHQAMVRALINEFLGTNFNRGQWLDIYTQFGNGVHEQLCREFIRSGFDFNLVKAVVNK